MADPIDDIARVVPLPRSNPRWPSHQPSLRLEAYEISNPNGSGPDPSPPSAWLFQSNPLLYDLRGALRSLTEQAWSVSRYAKRIRTGDRVYLWEAGRWGGIAAVGEISEVPRIRPEPVEQIPFARARDLFLKCRLRVGLRVLRVIEPLIARSAVLERPELGGLGILRCSRGTNFPLTRDQWHAMNLLIAED